MLDIVLDAVILETTDRAGNHITEGSAQGDGDAVVNCSNLTYTDENGETQTDGPSCVTTLIKGEFAVPRLFKNADPGPYLPGATVTWEVTVTNTDGCIDDRRRLRDQRPGARLLRRRCARCARVRG